MLELLSLYQRARALLTLVYLDWARAATFQPAPTPASRKKNRKLLKLYISAKTSELQRGDVREAEMKSSLTYQLLLYLGAYYFFCYELLELLLLLYKAILLPYPTGVLFSEVLFVLLLAVVEAGRLLSGGKGNLTESAGDKSLQYSLLSSIPSCLPEFHK